MAWPKGVTVATDASVLVIFLAWSLQVLKFILNTSLIEVPEKRTEILILLFWFVCHSCHATFMFRNRRFEDLKDCYHETRLLLRDWVVQTSVGINIRYLMGFLGIREVCIAGNAISECLIVGAASCFALMGGVEFFYGNDPTFYFQNFTSLILYCALEVRLKDFYNVKKLITHFCYVCIHAGYLGECWQFEESYIAFNTGFAVSILFVMWHVLDFTPSARSPSHSPFRGDDGRTGSPTPEDNVPRDEQSKKSRKDNDPVGETSPGDSKTSPRESRWKPKQKKKKRR